MQRRQAEEKDRRVELMHRQRAEQAAMLNIRRVVFKLRSATVETLPALEQELAEALQRELPNCIGMSEKVTKEAGAVLEDIKGRFRKAEEARLEVERKRQESIERAQELLRQLSGFIEAAESACKGLAEESARMAKNGAEMTQSEVEASAKTVDEAGTDVRAKLKACSDHILQNGVAMRVGDAVAAPTKADAPAEEQQDRPSLAKLVFRMNECTKLADATQASFTLAKQSLHKMAVAKHKMEASEKQFDRYGGKDSMMTKKDVEKYAKSEFQFSMPAAAIEEMWKALAVGDAKGVKKAHFQQVRVAVGIARERAKDAKRKAERLEKEKKLAEAKEKRQEKVNEATSEAEAAEVKVKKAEDSTQAFGAKDGARDAASMIELADEADELIKDAREDVASAKKAAAGLLEGCEDDLKAWLAGEQTKLEATTGRLEARLAKATAQAAKFREDARKKENEEVSIVEKRALKMLKHHQRVNHMKNEDLFEALDTSKDGKIDQAEWLAFFKTCAKDVKEDGDGAAATAAAPEPTADELSRLFASLDEEESGELSKETFVNFVRHFMKVARDTVITSCMTIKDSKTLRRLEVNEVVEILQGPQEEESVKVMRVHAKAMNDNVEGWISLVGNQGTTFLEEGGNVFKVITETILTESFELDGSGATTTARKLKDTTRKLKVGEIVEVREWAKKEEKSGLMRMRCKCRADGAMGWVTTMGNQGTVFVEVA